MRQRVVTVGVLAIVLACAAGARASADLPGSLVDPYLRIQTKLADDKLDGAQTDAGVLAAEAEKLRDAAQALVSAARKLQAARDLKAAREAFGQVSEALIAYADATRSGLGAEVRVAYCPMAQKSWLQRGDQIANPYYGQQMLRCGEFKKR